MSIKSRLERLETTLDCKTESTTRSAFRRAFEGFLALNRWLGERGYADALAAVEAGETGPESLSDDLREQAEYDHKRRVYARVERVLYAGQLPNDADLRLVSHGPGDVSPESGSCM